MKMRDIQDMIMQTGVDELRLVREPSHNKLTGPLTDEHFSKNSIVRLSEYGITTWEDVCERTDDELLIAAQNRKTYVDLRKALRDHRMQIKGGLKPTSVELMDVVKAIAVLERYGYKVTKISN